MRITGIDETILTECNIEMCKHFNTGKYKRMDYLNKIVSWLARIILYVSISYVLAALCIGVFIRHYNAFVYVDIILYFMIFGIGGYLVIGFFNTLASTGSVLGRYSDEEMFRFFITWKVEGMMSPNKAYISKKRGSRYTITVLLLNGSEKTLICNIPYSTIGYEVEGQEIDAVDFENKIIYCKEA